MVNERWKRRKDGLPDHPTWPSHADRDARSLPAKLAVFTDEGFSAERFEYGE